MSDNTIVVRMPNNDGEECFVCSRPVGAEEADNVKANAAPLHTCDCLDQVRIHAECYRNWWIASGRCPHCNTQSQLHDTVKFVVRSATAPPGTARRGTTCNSFCAYLCLVALLVAAFAFAVVITAGTNCGHHHHDERLQDDDDLWGLTFVGGAR